MSSTRAATSVSSLSCGLLMLPAEARGTTEPVASSTKPETSGIRAHSVGLDDARLVRHPLHRSKQMET